MRTRTINLTEISLSELKAILQPYFRVVGLDFNDFVLQNNGIIFVESDFDLEEKWEGSIHDFIKGSVSGDIILHHRLAEILAVLAGEGLIPKSDYIIH